MRLKILGLALTLAGCSTSIEPPRHEPSANPSGENVFSHQLLDQVLSKYVDGAGRVDYRELQAHPEDLDRYYAQIAACSPDSHPERFPDEPSRFAYWINAYNAAVLKTVITYYPIDSVSDVSGPPLSGLVSPQIGFFYFQKLTFGGLKINLYNLEHEIIRARFPDPRLHFAINCASAGCPRLPQRAFHGDGLDDRLEAEARLFVNEPRNLRIDEATQTMHLSSIFDWYREDFLALLRQRYPQNPTPDLLDYARLYLTPGRLEALDQAEAQGYRLQFVAYDWRLNDQMNDQGH